MTKLRLIIISGAGLSAESGIPTFRDKDGLWHNHKIEDVALGSKIETNKELICEFFNQRRKELESIQPNMAHLIIAELQHLFGSDRVLHFTQNIDDLMEKAGAPETIHVHGKLWEYSCIECGNVWNIGYSEVDHNATCPKCPSTRVRPAVVLFEEAAPNYHGMYVALRSATSIDTILIIGTSGNVLPYNNLIGSKLDPNTGHKLLATKDPMGLGTQAFDAIFLDPITEVLPNIKNFLINRMMGVAV